MRVLLVEDHVGQASVAEGFIKIDFPDAEVIHEESLGGALRRLQEIGFDVILLDLGLPDGEGVEVVVTVFEAGFNVPIVILTAQGEEGLGPLCIQAGATDFICKRDLTPETLNRALRYATSRKGESVVRDLSRMLGEFRAVAERSESELPGRFQMLYETLLTEARFLMTDEHVNLVAKMARSGVTASQAIVLHAECVENVCREADERARNRYLNNCQLVLTATLRFLADFYQKQGQESETPASEVSAIVS